MDKEKLNNLIDKVIGKDGPLRVPAYWMREVLVKIVEFLYDKIPTKVGQLSNDKGYLISKDVFKNTEYVTKFYSRLTLKPNTLIVVAPQNNSFNLDFEYKFNNQITVYGIKVQFRDYGGISNLSSLQIKWLNGAPPAMTPNKDVFIIFTNTGEDSALYGEWSVSDIADEYVATYSIPTDGTYTISYLGYGDSPFMYDGISIDGGAKEPYREEVDFGAGEHTVSFYRRGGICAYMFHSKVITKLVIPEGVTYIPSNAFLTSSDNTGSPGSLEDLTLPGTVNSFVPDSYTSAHNLQKNILKAIRVPTLDTWLNMSLPYSGIQNENTVLYINGTPISEVVIPSGSVLKQGVFTKFGTIKKITIPADATIADGDEYYVFRDNTGLEEVVIADDYSGTMVSLFSGCSGLKTVNIPSAVTELDGTFSNCASLSSIVIPDTGIKLSRSPFYNCTSLASLHIPDSVVWETGHTSVSNIVAGCNNLAEITGKDSVDNRFIISNGELRGVAPFGLEELIIPEGVTTLPQNTLMNNSVITKVSLPSTAKDWALLYLVFDNCEALSTLNLAVAPSYHTNATALNPEGVLYAFYNCPNLSVFEGAGAALDGRAIISEGVFIAYAPACEHAESLAIPDGVTAIANAAFYNITNIDSVTFPSTVKMLSSCAFRGGSIGELNLNDGLTAIGCYAFKGDHYNNVYHRFESLVVPDSVTTIGKGAFEYCINLKNATIGSGVSVLARELFSSCKSLTKVTLKGNISTINEYAFGYCSALTEIDFTNCTSVPTLKHSNALVGCSADLKIKVPSSLVNSWKRASNWSTYASRIVGI